MRNATPVLPFKMRRPTRRHYFLRVNFRPFSFFTRTTRAKINPGLGSGPHLVGQIGSGVWISASYQRNSLWVLSYDSKKGGFIYLLIFYLTESLCCSRPEAESQKISVITVKDCCTGASFFMLDQPLL